MILFSIPLYFKTPCITKVANNHSPLFIGTRSTGKDDVDLARGTRWDSLSFSGEGNRNSPGPSCSLFKMILRFYSKIDDAFAMPLKTHMDQKEIAACHKICYGT